MFWYAVTPPEPGYSRFEALCRDRWRVIAHAAASPVSGFLITGGQGCDGTCEFALKRQGYEYVEASVEPESWSNFSSAYPGMYRFTVRSSNDPACKLFDEIHPPSTVKRGAYEICIGAEPIPRFTSRYRIDRRKMSDKVGRATLKQFHTEIVDAQDNLVVVEKDDFSVSWTAYFFGPFQHAVKSCDQVVPERGANETSLSLPTYLPVKK